MNARILFVSMLAIAAFTGCNNEDNPMGNGQVQETKAVSLKINMPSVQTKTIDTPVGTPTALFESATLYFYESNAEAAIPIQEISLSGEQLNAATVNVKVKSSATYVAIKGNITSTSDDITKLQVSSNDFDNKIPLISPKAAITGTGTYAATVVPVPNVARIEVSGKITPTGTKTWETVTLKSVYINNFYQKVGTTIKYFPQSDATTWDGKYVDPFNVMADMNITSQNLTDISSKTKAAGYQVFPSSGDANITHIILKLSCKKKTDASAIDRFITIVKYKKDTNTGATLDSFDAGYIYKIDISSLNDKFKDDTDPTDPEPEMTKKDVAVSVTVYQWKEQVIVPDI